jgi:hypothetical protein
MEISVFRTDFESGPTETGRLIAYSCNSMIIDITVHVILTMIYHYK